MDWTDNEEKTNDRCSTASSLSNSGEVDSVQLTQTKSAKNQTSNGNHSSQFNGNASVNLDSMSDGELSDFSLNDSDDDEFRVTAANGIHLFNQK